MKRFYMRYESDEVVCGSNEHDWAGANTISTCKKYIRECRRYKGNEHPRNFRVYDIEVTDENGCAVVVYRED